MLDVVEPEPKRWVAHERTGVCYHPDDCSSCENYVEHLMNAKNQGERSLLDVRAAVRDFGIDEYRRSDEFKDELDNAYQDSLQQGRRYQYKDNKRA